MENWQKDHINKNMPQLLEYTRCLPKLLQQLKADGVFSSADVAKIKSKSDEHEQASCFFDIIVTRTNGYIELLKALSECRQDGAAKVLMKGIPTNLHSKLQVHFLGKDHSISELLDEKDILELTEKLKSLNLNKYLSLILECNLKVVPLLKNTIPNPEKFYVPRHLVRRRNLDLKVFTTDCQDVFVFSNFTRAKLSQLASSAKCHTASSRDQIDRLTSRFILLEDARHWKDICDIAKDVPVHLITYDEDEYLLTKTTGGSRVLNQFLSYNSGRAQDCITEDDVAALEREISLCICDLPGMGKSLLLANLARTFSECNPNLFIAFISLPTIAQFLQAKTTLNNFPQAMEVLAHILAPTELSAHILALLLKTRLTPIYLYLDGLDEVPTELLPQVKLFLNTLKNEEKWIRIHVTARTHMLHELESALGVIPYDIVPFTHDNKIQFLTNFWKNQDPSSNETRLAEFATHCLDKWKKHMKEESVQITGIPLQCRLVAEVYSRHAHRYARESVQLKESDITETSLLQLYHSYLQIGLARVENHILSSTMTKSQQIAEKLLAVEQFHIWQALKVLYPKMAESYAKHYSVGKALEDGEFETIMCMGFLVPDIGEGDSSVKFAHRTFAEFFTSRFFASILSKNQLAKNIDKKVINFEKLTLKYFFQKVAIHEFTDHTTFYGYEYTTISIDIYRFSSYVVMKFVNDELHNYSGFNSLVPLTFSNAVSADSCYGLMISTLVQKLPSILRVVKFALAGLSYFKLWWYRRYLSGYNKEGTRVSRQEDLLYISARFANAAVARELYDILSQVCCLDLYSLHNDRRDDRVTPLHTAVSCGDYEIVEHVLQYSTTCDVGEMLEYMIESSYDNPITVLQSKTTICQLLCSRSPFAINKLYDYIIKDPCRPCLIKLLLQNGLQIGHEDRTRILELAAEKWRADELYDMFVLFNNNVNKDSNFREINFPLFAALKKSPDATKLIPKIPNVQWDAQDKYGNTLIHMSVAGDASICIIEKCLENGAKLNAENKFGWSGLHVAAAKRNVKVMYYLLEKGASITEKSDTGDTPLHLFFLNSRAAYELLAIMNLAHLYQFIWKRYTVHTSTLNELVTKIFTSQQNEQVLQLLSDKNEKGHTILHNFLYDKSKELEMSCKTLVLIMDNLHIKATETDHAGKDLLDAAIAGAQNESIIKLLSQKFADHFKL